MKCPCCPDSVLVMSDRQGVEIDYCPSCRGIWLDRGELDKILERAAAGSAAPGSARPASVVPAQAYHHSGKRPDFEDSDFGKKGHYQRSYKKSWLSEIFD